MNDGVAQISKNIRQELYVKYGVVIPMPVRENYDTMKMSVGIKGNMEDA